MTVSLDSVRKEIGRLSQGPGWVDGYQGAVTGGDDSFADLAFLADATRGPQFYVRQYVLRPQAGLSERVRSRRIASYDPLTGTLGVTPYWAVPMAAGEPYEAGWKWEPRLVEAAIKRVHGRMYAAVEVAAAAVPGALQYALTDAAAWLQYASQAERVTLRTGATLARASVALDGAVLRQVATGGAQQVVLDLTGGPLATDEGLVTRAYIPYQTLTPLTDGPSVTIAPLAWLAWETIHDVLRLPNMNLDDELRARAAREVRQLRKGALPPPSSPLFVGGGAWGAAGVGRY